MSWTFCTTATLSFFLTYFPAELYLLQIEALHTGAFQGPQKLKIVHAGSRNRNFVFCSGLFFSFFWDITGLRLRCSKPLLHILLFLSNTEPLVYLLDKGKSNQQMALCSTIILSSCMVYDIFIRTASEWSSNVEDENLYTEWSSLSTSQDSSILPLSLHWTVKTSISLNTRNTSNIAGNQLEKCNNTLNK